MSVMSSEISQTILFVALETATGNQLVKKFDIGTGAVSDAYTPGAGTSCNVLQHPTNEDVVYFYGQFGGNVNIIKHTISTVNNADISVNISNTINGVTVNPSNDLEMYCYSDGNTTIYFTDDGGATWTVLNASGSLTTVAGLVTLWSAAGLANRLFASGDDTANAIINYSPNGGLSGVKVRDGALASLISKMVYTDG